MAITLLGVNGAPALGFPNGKRLVRWVGFRQFLDEPDRTDPQGRTFRYLLNIGHYPPHIAKAHRDFASQMTRRQAIEGVTLREAQGMDEHHNALSRTYQWGGANGFVEEMDAKDAEQVMAHPVLGQEFAYADVPDARTTPRLPNAQVRAQWATERVFQVPRTR